MLVRAGCLIVIILIFVQLTPAPKLVEARKVKPQRVIEVPIAATPVLIKTIVPAAQPATSPIPTKAQTVLTEKDIPQEIMVELKPIPPVPFVDQRLHTILKYESSWGGMHVATMFVELTPVDDAEDAALHGKVIIKTHGLLKLAVKYFSETEGTSHYNGYEQNSYRPHMYKTFFKYRKKRRNIDLTYNADGGVESETNKPPEKRWKRKEVPPEGKQGAYDPITLALQARSQTVDIFTNRSSKRTFSLPLYDGRRRSNQKFTVEKLLVDGLIKVAMEEIPVSGYTNNELKQFKAGPQIIDIYLSPKTFIPQKAKGKSPLGSAWVHLKKTCASLEGC